MAEGIGQATAISFAREGCRRIVIADRNAEGLRETMNLIRAAVSPDGIDVLSPQIEVSIEEQITSLVSQAVNMYGRIDYAVNAAGK
jgi:NAD(P)-dependent dehydrogenase (short-subunit alcohol dehydrogenase family)